MAILFIGAFFFTKPVHALSDVGPDPADFTNPDNATEFGYIVTGSANTDTVITQTQVKIYFTNNTGTKTVTISDANLCTDARGSAPSSGGNYRDVASGTWANGDTSTEYWVTAGSYTTSGSPVLGLFSGSNTCYKTAKTLSFPGSKLIFNANTGYYEASFFAQSDTAHGQNVFDLKLSDADGIVGYSSGQAATSFGLARETPSTGYRNYYLKFGPDCTVTTPQAATGSWYDDDNGDPAVQPNPMSNQVRKYDYNGNFVGTVPMTFTGAQTVTDVSTSGNPTDLGSHRYEVYSGSKKKVTMHFTVEPGYRYMWVWYNVYYVNLLQFQQPFDSIYYINGCQSPASTVQPSSSVDKPQISYPDTATFTHYANISSYQRQGTVNYSIQRTRDGVATGPPQTGTYTFNANGQFTLKTNTFTPTAADLGANICEQLTLTDPIPTAQDLNIVGNPSQACTQVVARPYVSVTNNDVWAGSRFDYSDNECSGQTQRQSAISSWVNSGGGATGQYGVFASGLISQFGSANLPGGTGLTFANVPSLGSFGAPTRCIPDYYSTISAGGGGSWPGVGSLPAGAGQKTYVNNGSVTISGGTVPAGTQAVLVVNGDVNITGDINYADSYSSQAGISSLWIIAKGNINIQENVTNLAGLYVAQSTADNSTTSGIIQTCVKTGVSVTYSPLTTQVCNSQLNVYGAFLANKVYWQRTNGTAGPGQPPAETIHFDPQLYLSSPFSKSATGGLTTQDVKELPPIY
jgi:hypothetical protein